MKHSIRYFLPFALLAVAGCVSHPEAVRNVQTEIGIGKIPDTSYFDKKTTGKDAVLSLMERGRARQLTGDYQGSSADYQAAVDAFRAIDDKAVVSVTDVGAKAGSILINDLVIPYRGEGYERLMLFQLDAFNRAALGELENVGVDVRNLAQQLEKELESNEKARNAFAEAQENAGTEERSAIAGASSAYAASNSAAIALAGTLANSFQNPYAYAFAGLWYESQKDFANAAIAYSRARKLQPDCFPLKLSIVRVARALGRSVPNVIPPLAENEGEVFLFAEQGYNLSKTAFSLPIPLPRNLVVVSVPCYSVTTESPAPPTIQTTDGFTLARAEPVCDFRAYAVKALQEHMPAILTRQVLRATVKAVANDQVRRQSQIAGLAMLAFNAATERPDLRSWVLLPRYAHLARFSLPAGKHKLLVVYPFGQTSVDVTIRPGRTTLVHATGVPGRIEASSTPF